jgi:hypothetical protein
MTSTWTHSRKRPGDRGHACRRRQQSPERPPPGLSISNSTTRQQDTSPLLLRPRQWTGSSRGSSWPAASTDTPAAGRAAWEGRRRCSSVTTLAAKARRRRLRHRLTWSWPTGTNHDDWNAVFNILHIFNDQKIWMSPDAVLYRFESYFESNQNAIKIKSNQKVSATLWLTT